ncbi:pnp [Wigglesworthia glossinidia endosymbiont of Glossina brevipalpis]|uniref:Polyribonucleotide nucleotidyltransferase n=1 Tax=Wigglesworthia glossinidia brevipalpis TaxID=36870 RepID=PNP_WIGBR|nr:RecName: Full=Polyribonucleotide nucleotidyltransferase; AltName: Full=Polynucleotide phosphorylase; Short=PNPase [Wigglesworthia glossinidia endosymbiont of Glossina brevipalpis]BAC24368.1 pnp [Wigglesworthia glossinidia endosymbiont of Glossina brevipalpis]
MLKATIQKFQYGKNIVTIETGMIARQATSAVMVRMDDTSVFVTVVADKKEKLGQKFFPLTVNYQERTYSIGRFPGGFFRREGRPNENEVLVSRLIDRSVRPLFPKNFFNDIQIIATVMSVNPQVNPDIVSIIGASAALSLSGLPFKCPIGSSRIGYIDNKYILNPTTSELIDSKLDMIVSGSSNAVLMVESSSNILQEKNILEAILFGNEQNKIVIENIDKLKKKFKKENLEYDLKSLNNNDIQFVIEDLFFDRIKDSYKIPEKKKRLEKIENIKNDILNNFINNNNTNEEEILYIIQNIERKIVRNRIISGKPRIDGRTEDMVRNLDIHLGILPRTHGSSLFTRGETQALVTTTLGTERDAQNIDDLVGDKIDRFLFHYNFPPYCVGEVGIISSPKRREIGHGKLAKRGMLAVMPDIDKFPYTIRIVSEITESNGSSSMASVCGASLSLMDAGVPISSSVAGIAMGLIKEKDKFVVLTDILGDEDYLGDMDFKVMGTREGVTALQMDIKIEGITSEILQVSLDKAKNARINILNEMDKVIKKPKNEISIFAPRIYKIKINPEKIKDVIGKGGSVIRMLTEKTKSSIEIEDDGTVKVISTDIKNAQCALKKIKDITHEIKINKIYVAKITRISEFGIFACLINNKEGLIHVSKIPYKKFSDINNNFKIGQIISVKVIEIDRYGRIRLSFTGTDKNKNKKFFNKNN